MHARLSTAGWLLLSCALARPATAQIAPRILHDGLGCIVAGQHAVIEARVEPTEDLVTVKVYFRAEIYPAFFYVEAAPSGGGYQAVLPRPTRDVAAIVYYLEAVDRSFNSLRTEEFRPRVVRDPGDCDEDSRQPAYVESPDGITVGATAAGPSFPPGFLSQGIVGTISAAGRAAGGSAGTIIGIGAAAGAAAGVGILVGGGDAGTTTVPAGGGPTTTLPITTSIPLTTSVPVATAPLVACFDTVPNPPTIPVAETVRFDASCSRPRDEIARYVWDFNDGREGSEGRVVTRQYTSPGVFPAELVVTDIRGVQALVEKRVRVNETPGPGPGPTTTVPTTTVPTTTVPTTTVPTTTIPGSADLRVTSLSFNPPTPANVDEAYTINYLNGGPDLDPTVTLVVTFNASGAGGTPIPVTAPGCGASSGGGSLTVSCVVGPLASGAPGSKSITVQFPSSDTYFVNASISGGTSDPSPGNNSSGNIPTIVTLKAGADLETSFVSEIQSGTPGQVQASIEMNGLGTSATRGGGPSRHRMKPQPGPNVLAGYAAAPDLEGALWKLDFSQTEGFVPGSIAVETGDVVSAATHIVVFRLAGSETRIRFRFRMDP
jgi:hypothetical protein